jgi:hypothetical protein
MRKYLQYNSFLSHPIFNGSTKVVLFVRAIVSLSVEVNFNAVTRCFVSRNIKHRAGPKTAHSREYNGA